VVAWWSRDRRKKNITGLSDIGAVPLRGIRPYRIEDLDELHSLICETLQKSYSGTYSPGAIEFFKQYHSEENITADALHGHTILFQENNRLVGTGTLLGTNIRRVFVLPERQGMGIGAGIMAELESMAASEGTAVLDLDSSMVSVGFYHRLGYAGDALCFIDLADRDRLDYVPMTKRIRP
jgi:GNAT superfamily N-acetyltransferase